MLIARPQPRPVYLDKYRTLPRDSGAGNPLLVFGKGGQVERLRTYWAARVGTYWTVPVLIPLRELRSLHAQIHTEWRLQQVREKMRRGVDLDPIELGVFPNGCAWLIDGNHRLVAAREANREAIKCRLTFVGS